MKHNLFLIVQFIIGDRTICLFADVETGAIAKRREANANGSKEKKTVLPFEILQGDACGDDIEEIVQRSAVFFVIEKFFFRRVKRNVREAKKDEANRLLVLVADKSRRI